MVDPRIKTGDVCIDVVDGAKVQVVGQSAETVAEYRERQEFDLAEYKSHPLLGVTDDDTVWETVYLPGSVTHSFNKSYDFPESRLVRIPVEEADPALERIQRKTMTDILSILLVNALGADQNGAAAPENFESAIRECWPEEHGDVLDVAHELAETSLRGEADAD